jgi:hypothetical protein
MLTIKQRIGLIVMMITLWINRNLVRFLIQAIKDVYVGTKMARKLPGPGKDLEHPILGHLLGPAVLRPGEQFTPEWFTENIVERWKEVGQQYSKEGLFRSKLYFMVIKVNGKTRKPGQQNFLLPITSNFQLGGLKPFN